MTKRPWAWGATLLAGVHQPPLAQVATELTSSLPCTWPARAVCPWGWGIGWVYKWVNPSWKPWYPRTFFGLKGKISSFLTRGRRATTIPAEETEAEQATQGCPAQACPALLTPWVFSSAVLSQSLLLTTQTPGDTQSKFIGWFSDLTTFSLWFWTNVFVPGNVSPAPPL